MGKQANRTIWRRMINFTVIALFLSNQCGLVGDTALSRIIDRLSSLIVTPCYAEFDVSPREFGNGSLSTAFTVRRASPSPKINVSSQKSSYNAGEFTKTLASRLITPAAAPQNPSNRIEGTRASNPTKTHALSVKASTDINPLRVKASNDRNLLSNYQLDPNQAAKAQLKPDQTRSVNIPQSGSQKLNDRTKKKTAGEQQIAAHKEKSQSTVNLTPGIKNKTTYTDNSLVEKEKRVLLPRDTVDTVSPQKFEVKSTQDTEKHQKKVQNSSFGVIPIFKSMIMEQFPLMLATSDTGLRLPASQEKLPDADPFDLPLNNHKSRTEEIFQQSNQLDITRLSDIKIENSQSLLNSVDLIALTAVNYAKTGLSPPGNSFSSISRIQTSRKDNRLISSSHPVYSTGIAPDSSLNNSTNRINTPDNSFDAGSNRRYDCALFPYPPQGPVYRPVSSIFKFEWSE